MIAFSCASRLGYCLGSTKSASMPWPRAMSSAGAAARSDISTTTTAGSRPERAASTRAWKFEPLPEASTPTRSSSGIGDRPRAVPDLTHLENALPSRGQGPGSTGGISRAHDEQIADAHIEGAPHLGLLDPPALLDHAEDRRYRPRARVDHRLAPVGENAGEVLGDPTARDVGHGEHGHAPEQIEHGLDVDPRGLEELVGHGAIESRHGVRGLEAQPLEDHLAHQRITVGVKARGGETEHAVARSDFGPRHDAASLDHAHREAREVVLPRRVEGAHLRRLSPHQRAAGP